jgi:hypothetical protein
VPIEKYPGFRAALMEERDRLNAQFALRRHAGSPLDDSAVLKHLCRRIAPLVEHVHRQFPERTRGALATLFDLSLDLFAASLLGEQQRHGYVVRLWEDV